MASAATQGRITSHAPGEKLRQASAFLPATHRATNTAQSAPLLENILRYIVAARNQPHNCPFNKKSGGTPSYQYEASYHGGQEPCIGVADSYPRGAQKALR